MTILKTDNITMKFGGLTAVKDFSLELNQNEIVALIGPNGAGKTTAFNMITGVYKPTSGKIIYNGQSIDGLKPDAITRLGLARTFQNIRLFKELSVLDNVFIANHLRLKSNVFEAIFRLPRYRREEKENLQKSEFLIEKLGLKEFIKEKSSSLPYGLQLSLIHI